MKARSSSCIHHSHQARKQKSPNAKSLVIKGKRVSRGCRGRRGSHLVEGATAVLVYHVEESARLVFQTALLLFDLLRFPVLNILGALKSLPNESGRLVLDLMHQHCGPHQLGFDRSLFEV